MCLVLCQAGYRHNKTRESVSHGHDAADASRKRPKHKAKCLDLHNICCARNTLLLFIGSGP